MHIGMLWFDSSQSTLPVKIQKAADYYEKKYGKRPDLCLVHLSALEKDQAQLEISKVTVRTSRYVLPSHLWLGVEDKPEEV